MLLSSTLGEGLEPVCIVGGTHLQGPLFHPFCHGIGNGTVKGGPIVHHVDHLGVHVGRQVLPHLLTVEHVFPEIVGGSFRGCWHLEGFFLKGLFNDLESE